MYLLTVNLQPWLELDEFTDECVDQFPCDHAEGVTMCSCDEKEMASKARHENHGCTEMTRNKFASAHATNSAVYDAVT